MRKLASIQMINEIRPIENADAIECAVVGGWTVVVGKGEFKQGDRVVFCEIDSWIPHHLAPFLSKGQEPREFNGVKGERLRTVKFRGQLSQGLLLNLDRVMPETNSFQRGDDVSEYLDIVKYEAPIPVQLAGEVRGMFPSFISKTDQERIQNLGDVLAEWKKCDLTWEITEKLDGASMTVYVNDQDRGVCSRNLNLKESESNTFWRVANDNLLIFKIAETGRNLAFQGELVGEKIQGNPYRLKGQHFFLFDIYDIDTMTYLPPAERRRLAKTLDIEHVPVLHTNVSIEDQTVQSLIKKAEGKSSKMNKVEREGIVFKCNENEASFKAISNKFLLNGGE
jgi:RNA ligase (TIGR02306 family)